MSKKKTAYFQLVEVFHNVIYGGPNPSHLHTQIIWWVSCILRIFWGILIPFQPLLGWFISFNADNFDYGFAIKAGVKFKQYEYTDKILDIWFRMCMVAAAYYQNWPQAWLFPVLFIIRLIGDILFALTKKQESLFIFPNIIEPFFPAYIIYLWVQSQTMLSPVVLPLIFLACTLIKIYHEYQLHQRKWIDPWSQEYLHKHPGLRPQGE